MLSRNSYLDNNESYSVDRSESDWASTIDQLDNTWKKLISYEFINELLSQVDENETALDSSQFTQQKMLDALDKIKKKYERWHKNITEFEASDVQELYLSTLTQMFDPHLLPQYKRERKI